MEAMKVRACILGIAVLAAALAGCTGQRDLDVVSNPLVKIKCDWGRARLTPDVWTVMFYGDNTPQPTQFVMTRPVDTLQLSPDTYRTLVVNGTLGSGIDYVRFRGTDSYDSFEAYATVAAQRKNGDILVNEPDTLASTALLKTIGGESRFTAKYVDGRLQPGDQRHYVLDSIEYIPCRLVYRIKVTVTINNLDYLLPSRQVTGEISGLSGGVMVASRMPTHAPVFYSLAFRNNNPQAQTVGNVETVLATFGPPLNLDTPRTYLVDLMFILNNNKPYMASVDVTDQVTAIAAQIKDRIDRGVCDAGLDLELKVTVTLPEPSTVGDINVDPWGDGENEEILL